jgi:hypothetical protein
MAHHHRDDARRSFGDKLNNIVGDRGEHPEDRASRIAGVKATPGARGDSGAAEEEFTAAPPRQVSNYGTVKGK